MPLISVIVPVYKVESYLERCVNSILRQTFADFELILIDDGSPDNCGTICDTYAKKDSRVIVIHQKNGGLSVARNSGIDWVFQNSPSEWITFIDSDDWVHPQYLEILYQAVDDTDTEISVCNFCRISKQEPYDVVENAGIQTYSPEDFWISNRVNATVAWGKLYKKQCFSEVRYPVGKLHEDEYITYRVLFSNEAISVTEEILYYYFQNDEGIMQTTWDIRRLDGIWAFKEQLDFFVKYNYKKATYCAADCYVDYLVYALTQLQASKTHEEAIRLMRKELRNVVRKYGKHLEMLEENGTLVYKVAYPRGFEIREKMKKKKKHFVVLYKEKGMSGLCQKIRKK